MQTSQLHGIMLGRQEVKSALYGDDVLWFTSKPAVDIVEIQAFFEEYGKFSGMKINFRKSEILQPGLLNMFHLSLNLL